jgi:hypothetical protein
VQILDVHLARHETKRGQRDLRTRRAIRGQALQLGLEVGERDLRENCDVKLGPLLSVQAAASATPARASRP